MAEVVAPRHPLQGRGRSSFAIHAWDEGTREAQGCISKLKPGLVESEPEPVLRACHVALGSGIVQNVLDRFGVENEKSKLILKKSGLGHESPPFVFLLSQAPVILAVRLVFSKEMA